MLFLYNMD